jgi:hypothetical protein
VWGIFDFGLLQDCVIDMSYAIVFWLIVAKFWNPVKVEEDGNRKKLEDKESEDDESEEDAD